MEEHPGILSRNEHSAECIVRIDDDSGFYIPDEYVNPPLSDGEYDLEIQYPNVNHRHRFVRANGIWKLWVAQDE
jgi:hypothetical protein